MTFLIRYRKTGQHTRCQVFSVHGDQHANLGELTMNEDEFDLFLSALKASAYQPSFVWVLDDSEQSTGGPYGRP